MGKRHRDRKPLPIIKCGESKCEEGLHAYRAPRKKKGDLAYSGIPCRDCGDDSFEWEKFRKRDLTDVELTFKALKNEYIRAFFWDIEIDKYLLADLQNKGRAKLMEEVSHRLVKVIKKCGPEIFRDGTQTPLKQHNIIYFAQHATATCCRKCIEIWHNIPYNKELDDIELRYLQNLITRYIDKKVPNLYPEGQLYLFSSNSE